MDKMPAKLRAATAIGREIFFCCPENFRAHDLSRLQKAD